MNKKLISWKSALRQKQRAVTELKGDLNKYGEELSKEAVVSIQMRIDILTSDICSLESRITEATDDNKA